MELQSISFVDDLGSTPATVNRRTGELYISARKWQQMTPDQRLFMILHEAGHVQLGTRDEFEADRFAFDNYVRTGRSLKNAVSALTAILSDHNPEHVQRAQAILKRAQQYDHKQKTKNMQPSFINTARPYKRASHRPQLSQPEAVDFFDFTGSTSVSHGLGAIIREQQRNSDDFDDFLKAKKKRKAKKLDAEIERKKIEAETQAKIALMQAEADLKSEAMAQARADAYLIQAEAQAEKDIINASKLTKKQAKGQAKIIRAQGKADKRVLRAEGTKAKREGKGQAKINRSEGTKAKRIGKGQKKINNSTANMILAEQGINARAGLAKGILGGMAKVAGAVGGSVVGAQAVKALPQMLGGGSNVQQLQEGLSPNTNPMIDMASQVLPAVGGALGAKMNTADPMEHQPQLNQVSQGINQSANTGLGGLVDDEDKKKEDSNKNLLIIGGIAAAVLLVVVIFMMNKK